MKIKLLLATTDLDYSSYLSKVFSDKYSDIFDVSVVTNKEKYLDVKYSGSHNVALVSQDMFDYIDFSNITLKMLFVDESGYKESRFDEEITIDKYQKISLIKKEIIENYSKVSDKIIVTKKDKANIVTFWSPIGGSGKTTTALAYAAKKTIESKKVLYLNLENFASTSKYFDNKNTSISTVFENLDNNVDMYIASNLQKDTSTAIHYFDPPKNYDDLNVLTEEHIIKLLNSCGKIADEVVVDLSSQCDLKVKTIFECTNQIFIIKDESVKNDKRVNMFMEQNNVANKNKHKINYINNKVVAERRANTDYLNLPLVQNPNENLVYKTLSTLF